MAATSPNPLPKGEAIFLSLNTKKGLANSCKSLFLAEREGLTSPSLRCREPPCNKKADKILQITLSILSAFFLRRERDSNPRYLSVQRFSRPPQSTTLPSLQNFFWKCFSLKAMQRYGFFLILQVFRLFFFVFALFSANR